MARRFTKQVPREVHKSILVYPKPWASTCIELIQTSCSSQVLYPKLSRAVRNSATTQSLFTTLLIRLSVFGPRPEKWRETLTETMKSTSQPAFGKKKYSRQSADLTLI